jgi:hypothetical protein
MPTTYEPIATQTLGSSAATVTFSSIPGTYTDLVLVSVFGSTNGMDIFIRFNGDSGGNYGSVRMFTNSSIAGSVLSGKAASITGIQPRTSVNQLTTVTTILKSNIMNYSNTTTYKNVITRYDYPGQTETDTGSWFNTAAITSLTLVSDGQQFTSGSIFTLYGIKAA